MSKEALKLALDNLIAEYYMENSSFAKRVDDIFKEALAEQPAQQDGTCSNALRIQGKAYPRTCKKCGLGPCVELAQQALDKKAENARDLGLDYEHPTQYWRAYASDYERGVIDGMQKQMQSSVDRAVNAMAGQPAQQEPVAWMYVNKSTHETKFQKHMRDFVDHSLWSEVPLYGEPLANHELQCVCGAVWLGDELVHLPDKRPPAQRTWVGLTDEETGHWAADFLAGAKWAEAKLRSKNEDPN